MSFGLTPWSSLPLSFTAIVPATFTNSVLTREDVIVGARYLKPLGGEDGNFLMGVGALDLPTGNTDHRSFEVGNQLLLHPTVVFAPGGSLLFFTVVSLPVHRHMTRPDLEDEWRVGLGGIFLFGGAP